MRVTTNLMFDQNLRAINASQAQLSDTQNQIASGKRLLKPSDDPVGASQVIRLTEELDKITQYKRNIGLASSNLELQETSLRSINGIMNNARVLTLRSGNGIFSQPDRQAIAAELEQIRNQVLDLMNTQNASGDFIFSGYQSEKQAFEFNPSDSDKPVKFMGDGGTNSIQISDSVSIQSTSSGKVIFEDVNARLNFKVSNGAALGDIRIGNQGTFDTFHKANFDPVTGVNNQFEFSIDSANQISVTNGGTGNVVEILPFTPGQMTTFKGIELNISGNPGDSLTLDLNPPEKQNIAQTLHKMVQALNDPNLSSQDFASMIDDTLVGIDNGLNKMARENASIGARLNIAESVKSNLLDSEVTNESARSAIRDVDLIKASSDLTRQEIGLEAAFASFSRVSKLSLFNFL